MKNWGISRKILYGSLAIRVLAVSIVLLAIPLIIYSFSIYHYEQRLKTKDVLAALNTLGNSRVQMIENQINFQKKWLQVQDFDASPTRSSEYSNTLFLKKNPAKDFVVVKSTDVRDDGTVFVKSSQITKYLRHVDFIFGAFDPAEKKHILVVGRAIDSSRIIAIVTPLELLVEPFGGVQNLEYDIGRSIINKEGIFIESSEEYLKGKSLQSMISRPINFSAFRNAVETFELEEEETNIALQFPIPQTNLFLLLDSPKSSLLHIHKRRKVIELVALWGLIFSIGGVCTLFLTWRLAKPLRQLSGCMLAAEKGDVDLRFSKDLLGFEINTLGMQFNQMMDSLVEHQSEVQRQRIEKERYAEELKIGRQIQRQMFPTEFPNFDRLDLTAGFLPAKEVGGDFYDVYQITDSRLMIVVADTAGKGIPACLYSLGVRSILRSYAASGFSVSEIVQQTNELFCVDTGDTGVFVTAWVGILDLRSFELEYHCAGHPPVLLKHKNDKVSSLTTKGIALGVVSFDKVTIKTVQVKPQDTLLLYTDGIIEAQNLDKKLYGQDRLLKFLQSEPFKGSQPVVEGLLRDVQNFAGKEPQADDMTVLSIYVKS